MASVGARRPRLVGVARGVEDPEGVAEFLGWVLDLEPRHDGDRDGDGDGFVLACRNGALTIHGDVARPVSVRFEDGPLADEDATVTVALDHVSIVCADLAATTASYESRGLVQTWSEPGAVHVSGADGYVALSQADWLDHGTHSEHVGPPRFLHLGLGVADLGAVERRLGQRRIPTLAAPSSPIGERLYLNDPDGDPRVGRNLELVEYRPGLVDRSGRVA